MSRATNPKSKRARSHTARHHHSDLNIENEMNINGSKLGPDWRNAVTHIHTQIHNSNRKVVRKFERWLIGL